MIDPTRIDSVIFDFAGTLASGRYFAPLGQEALDAIVELIFGGNAIHWADPWMKGELTRDDIASYLSQKLGIPKELIVSALHEGCSDMTFNSAVYEFACQQRTGHRKTALVTANMDVFTQVVVPAHRLDRLFDLVLNTADFRTLDKSELWRKAVDEFGAQHSFATSVLIDDNPRMVSLFRSLGGHAFQYEGDESLQI
jgi:beta-phosphoglucomutase-like phosphatase (HAD superfamily)